MASVREVMSSSLVVCQEEEPTIIIAQRLVQYDLELAVVVEDMITKKIVGVVTDQDILKKVVATKKDPEKVKVRDIMSRNVISVHEDETIKKALEVMSLRNVKKLVVLDQANNFVGLVTEKDILNRFLNYRKKLMMLLEEM